MVVLWYVFVLRNDWCRLLFQDGYVKVVSHGMQYIGVVTLAMGVCECVNIILIQ